MFSTKVLIKVGHLINFTSPVLETGGALYVFIRAKRRFRRLQDKGNTFTQLFQDSQYWSGLEDRPCGLPLKNQVLNSMLPNGINKAGYVSSSDVFYMW